MTTFCVIINFFYIPFQASADMEEVRLQIDHPSVQELAKKGEVVPSFHIVNCGKHYSLDPRPAVHEAKVVFDAYAYSALFGTIHLDIEDPHNVMKDIVGWFHGNTIRIDLARCVYFQRFAEQLGIPLLLKWAQSVEAAYTPVPGEPILVPL